MAVDPWLARARLCVRAGLSFLITASALYVVLSGHYSPSDVAWASGLLGIVIGYWLR
jgi:hypothetical protein